MLKKIFLLYLSSVMIYAQTVTLAEQFDVLAKNVVKRGNTVMAVGDVVIYSPTYYITSKKAIYNNQTGDLQLFGDVNILKNNIEQFLSDESMVNLNTNNIEQSPVFTVQKQSGIWINSKKLIGIDEHYDLTSSTVSSCDCVDPAWSIQFSSGSYDSKDQWIDTFNTRLYINDVPILYVPYFGFSTNKKRRTGLLMPTFGYSSTEGFYYAQPIFIAPQQNWDLELIPQYRTKRAWGMYAKYRLADSDDSILRIQAGYMKENGQYSNRYDLTNNSHFGADLNYTRYNIFSKKDHQDGLYADLHWLNDIEYKNLEEVDETKSLEKNIESKINYFYKTPSMYAGMYARYYLDSSLDNNDETLQQLPTLQTHLFSNESFIPNLFYSADVQYTNFYRPIGIGAQRVDLQVPLSYTISLFDEYVNLSLKEEISLTKLDYRGDNSNIFDDGTFIQAKHVVSLSTDLIKPYNEYIHTLNLSANAVLPSFSDKNGDLYGINSSNALLNPFPVTQENKNISFKLNQSVYDSDDLKQIINHKIKQSILYDSNERSSLGNLENQLAYNYPYGTLSNRLQYNHEDKKIIESSSNASFKYNDYYVKLNHYFSKETPNSNKLDTRTYIFDVGTKFNRFYTTSYKRYYDLQNDYVTKQALVFNIDKKCWGLDMKLEESLVAIASDTTDAIRQKIIYLQLYLKPIGGVKQKYDLSQDDR
ncbi:MAG: LPS-assembly protein LptD [Campylobacterota bacterium]|nr:LPS-assembly protein LptD [Campylobacterota bacterium]